MDHVPGLLTRRCFLLLFLHYHFGQFSVQTGLKKQTHVSAIKARSGPRCLRVIIACFVLTIAGLTAQIAPQFTFIQRLTNQEIRLQINAPMGSNYLIQSSSRLPDWEDLLTLRSVGANVYTDSVAPYLATRFYRAAEVPGANVLTGEHLLTTNGDAVIHTVNHAGFVLGWNGKWIYCDPVGGSFTGIPKADLVLITHSHSDHFNASVLGTIWESGRTIFVVPQAVYNSLSAAFKNSAIVLANGASTNVMEMTIDALPAYNANHPLGMGNGYILTLGGRRVYISGDTGNIPEMQALTDVDLAFVCMNVPYTMTVNEAATAVRAFAPRVVYPYHYRNQDGSYANLGLFKQLVGTDLGIEVRLRSWY